MAVVAGELNFTNAAKLYFLEKWESAKLEQQKLILAMEEDRLAQESIECQQLERSEAIISAEICTFLQNDTHDLDNETIKWIDLHLEEMERRTREISDTRVMINEALLRIEEMRGFLILFQHFRFDTFSNVY